MKPYYLIGFETIHQPKYDSLDEAVTKAEEKAKENLGITFVVSKAIALVSAPVPKPSTFWLNSWGPTEGREPSDKKFEHMDDTMLCPSHRPNGWRQVKEGEVQKHDYVYWLEDGVGEWASEFIEGKIPEGDVAIYRQPDRFF
jgi:hypothetical protein